ncbi:MAG: hypothetical protein JWR09_4085 [Mucilaginibacter sp.]|nr:hypothetical protein [Mucilaginibacter sp.]
MKPEIKYIELKTGYSDDGPAWIGRVEFSKSGQTVYFNGQAFKGNGHGWCFDIETKESYWITGIKKRGQNRHWAGKGKVMIDKLVVDDYLKLINSTDLDFNIFELVDVKITDKQRFASIENGTTDTVSVLDKFPDLKDLSIDELKNTIESLQRRECYTNPNNGQKFITVKRLETEKLLESILNKD